MLVSMLHILVLFRALLADGVQTLSIDSQLGTSVEDCFERISIGEKLSVDTIYRNVSELTLRECEHLCNQDQKCQTYVYGVGAKGNASCELSNLSEKEIRENHLINRDPDYDVYIRRVQCEQAPPVPFQTTINDPASESAHKPIFRPEIDEAKRPAADFPDLRPFETTPEFYSPYKPISPYNNYIDERPDSCHYSKPIFDSSPSYGDHRPQDVPYRPDTKPRPDSYDMLQFQDHYGRPPLDFESNYSPYDNYMYGHNPAVPSRPATYLPDEKPQYIYVQRPNKKPKPQADAGYNKPVDDHPPYDDYAPNQGYGPMRPSYPNRPNDYPSRPFDRPSDYQGQYANNYGGHQSNHFDPYSPTRPYRPSRPIFNRPTHSYGGNQYGNGNNHENEDNFQSQNHYGSSETPPSHSYNFTQAINTSHKPQDENNNSYGLFSQSPQVFEQYGSQYGKPTQKPILSSNQEFYGSHQGYGGSQPSYANDQNHHHNKPPLYESSESSNQSGYGTQFDSTSPQYGNPSSDSQSYGNNRPVNKPYGNKPHPTYNDRPLKPDIDKPSYNRPSYNNHHSSYGSNIHNNPSDNHKPEYKPITEKPIDYDRPDPQYSPPTYGNQDFESDNEGYRDSKKPSKPIQTNYRPTDIKPVYEYEVDRPNNVPSFVLKPGGQVVTSKPVAVGDYRSPGREPGHVLSYKACFRRVLAGKRALRSFVRRVVPCERLEDCRRECAEERTFHCESFNYRLDPTFRGKGICELMTRPIESFDIRRDFVEDKNYDFFEIDRNSLEPYCPETLRGPGLLHSGYLSSKPSGIGPSGVAPSGFAPSGVGPIGPSRFGPSDVAHRDMWMDRNDWAYWKDDRRRFHDRRPPTNYRRRYEDQFYIPYQIGLPSQSRSNDDEESPVPHNSYYGGYNTYYKDRNDYHKSINHWGLNDVIPPTAHRTYRPEFNYHDLGRTYHDVDKPYHDLDKTYHDLGKTYHEIEKNGPSIYNYGYGSWKRGRWNTSGSTTSTNGLDYGESSYYKPPKKIHEHIHHDEDAIKDCSPRRRPGMSLSSGAIRRSLLATNVVECEAACFNEREFKCVSYSFRYSSSHGTDNCFLSERPYRGLELSADSGSDVYAMPLSQGCVVSQKAFVESECFWHVRSGAAVSNGAVRSALTVAGLGACEAECIRASGFFCRGFSFRFDSPTIGDELENCILTSSPPTALDISRGLRASTGHELYARGNYGRGCEPALYDDVHPSESGECYLQYDNAAKLIGSAVRGQARVKDEQSCGATCTDAPFRCLSFSFNNNAPPDTDNCLLSEIRLFDLQRGVDYEHSVDDWLFAFDLFNSACWRKVHGRENPDPAQESPHPPLPPLEDHTHHVVGPSGPHTYLPATPDPSYLSRPPSGPDHSPSYPPHHKPAYPGHPPYEPPLESSYPDTRPGYLPERPIYKPVPPDPEDLPGPIGPGYKPSYPVEPSGPGYRPGHGYRPEYPVVPSGPSYRPDPGYKPGYPPRPAPQRPLYPGDREDEPIAVSWRHYTVSGLPCRKGTVCAQNQVAGHWACEPEGGEIGAWDYCCDPSHRCGYSEGFHKPWCYVGRSEDQWRPCSEKYYPYHQHNVPHPSSHGHRRGDSPRPPPRRRYPRPEYPDDRDRPDPTYLSEEDRRYWDDLYKNGPRAYYDKYGNPLPGYSRVPMESPPYIKYHHNYPRPGSGQWVPVSPPHHYQPELDRPVPGGLGAPRYWPVAYLHKGPPPNMTYFRYNDTTNDRTTTTETYSPPEPPKERPSQHFDDVNPDRMTPERNKGYNNYDEKNHRDEKNRNMTNSNEDVFKVDTEKIKNNTTTPKSDIKENITETVKVEMNKQKDEKAKDSEIKIEAREDVKMHNESDKIKGINGKIDLSDSIEVLNIEDANKGEKLADLRTLEAEERQIEAIGRLLASRRDGKLILEKRSQKDFEAKSIAIDKDLADFDSANKFPTTERRGIIQKVTKEEIEKERNIDKSLEVSETTFVRPPRVLSTTENIRKALVNGKVFYDAMLRDQKDFRTSSNSTRKPKSLRPLEERAPSVIQNAMYGKKKNVRARNVNPVNPVRKVRRVYRRRYNPEEVRRRLLERERNKKGNSTESSKI